MFVVTVQFQLVSGYAARFLVEMNANAEASLRLEDGCKQFDVCTGSDGNVFLYEVYDSEAAFQLHLQAPHFLSFNQTTAPWVAEKAVATYQRSFPVPQRRREEAGL